MAIQRAVVKGTLFDTVQVRNMFTCDVVTSGGDTAEILWDAYLDSIYTEVLPMCVTGLVFYSYEIQSPTGNQWETIDENAFEHSGSLSTEALPNAVAGVLIGKASGIRHLGRKFFSGLSEGATAENSITGTAIAAFAAALLAYITPFEGLGGGTITPGVRSADGFFHPFVGGVVSSLLGSMRRRKPGLGI